MEISKPSNRDLENARNLFRGLLQRRTVESEWQSFFTSHPYVLSRSLPIRLEPSDIVPRGRPGLAEPDFIFYPKTSSHIPLYGVIELKRPDSQIVTTSRSDIAILSRDAETAIQQAQHYADQPWSKELRGRTSGEMLFLGSTRYLFVVMGLAKHLAHALEIDAFRSMLESRLPTDLQILPYDTLLARFEAGIPRRMFTLVVEDNHEPAVGNIAELVGVMSEGANIELLYLYKSAVEGWVRSGFKHRHRDFLRTHLDHRTRDGERKDHTVYNYEPDRYGEVARCVGDERFIVRPECLKAIELLSAGERLSLFDGMELTDAWDHGSPK